MGCGACVRPCPDRRRSTMAAHRGPAGAAGRVRLLRGQRLRQARAARTTTVKGSQFKQPLLEFSGACAGCAETAYATPGHPAVRRPHVRRQRHRLLVASGAVPPPPRRTRVNKDGHGPAWANSPVRGQRRARPGHAAGPRGGARAVSSAKMEAHARARRRDRRCRQGAHRGVPGRPSTMAPPTREAVKRARCPRSSRLPQTTAAPTALRRSWRTRSTWPRSPCGSSAATAGPTTSATAASTTCSPPART